MPRTYVVTAKTFDDSVWIKTHVCATMEIAEAVTKDLVKRFGCAVNCKPQPQTNLGLDLGGAMVSSWEPLKITVDDFVFSFWGHQLSGVRFEFTRALGNERKGGYVKLHGFYNCTCLPVDLAQGIRSALDEPGLVKREEEFLAQWDQKMADLRANPHPNVDVGTPQQMEIQ